MLGRGLGNDDLILDFGFWILDFWAGKSAAPWPEGDESEGGMRCGAGGRCDCFNGLPYPHLSDSEEDLGAS